jgi:hypothetical protein
MSRSLLLPLLFTPAVASASMLLSLDFDDPADPWRDDAPAAHVLTSETFTEAWTGVGVQQDWASGSPDGAAAWFDGGSALSFLASPGMVWDPAIGVTVRFLFRSPGVFRASYLDYAPRMHAFGFGYGTQERNWDVDLDDSDGAAGLWTYWSGTGQYATLLGTSMGAFTTDVWHEYWWAWDGNVAQAWVRELGGDWIDVGAFPWSDPIGEVGAVNFIGRSSQIGGLHPFGYVGWIDSVRIAEGAVSPDLCPSTPAMDTADADGDGIGDACDDGVSLEIGGACPTGNTVSVRNLTPGGSFAVVRSASPGALTIPTGVCAGGVVPLAAPATLVATVTAPPSGQLDLAPTLSRAFCGRYLAVVDLATCRVSEPALVP